MNRLLLCLGFVVCFSLATALEPRFQKIRQENSRSSSVFAVLMGDSRQMFANHFFAKADAYFHNGKYPSIFDTANASEPSHMTEHAKEANGHDEHDGEDESEKKFTFMAPPKDPIEAFGRHFMFTGHAHLEGNGSEREILPWLQLSSEMDPHRIDTYVTAAFWLRTKLNNPVQAERFLRQGLRENPDSCEILLELGRIYDESKKNTVVARNLYELALKKWFLVEKPKRKPDELLHMRILGGLIQLDERESHWSSLLSYLQELKKISPSPDVIEAQIQEAKAKLSSAKLTSEPADVPR